MRRYQTYSGASYLPALCNVLDTVDKATPMPITSGNIKFEYSTSEDSGSIVWTHAVNGLDIEYNRVRIDFKDGFFEAFSDRWNSYAVGNTDVNVSEEEAKNMAREYAEKFVVDVWPGNLTTLHLRDDSIDAALSMQPRSAAEVYPLWQVQLLFDEVFNGWNGVKVSLWADTAEIIDAKVTGGLGGSSTETNDTAPTSEGNGTKPDLQPQPNTLINACIAIGFASVPMIAVAALVLKRKRR
jgi:hypothetical protein